MYPIKQLSLRKKFLLCVYVMIYIAGTTTYSQISILQITQETQEVQETQEIQKFQEKQEAIAAADAAILQAKQSDILILSQATACYANFWHAKLNKLPTDSYITEFETLMQQQLETSNTLNQAINNRKALEYSDTPTAAIESFNFLAFEASESAELFRFMEEQHQEMLALREQCQTEHNTK